MKGFLVLCFLYFSFLYAENKCEKLKTETECLNDRSCVWSSKNYCISTIKFVEGASNSGFSSRVYDPVNPKDRQITKNIPDPRTRRHRQNIPQKNETNRTTNP